MLTAYFPLTAVYGFHQPAEAWILRRYAQAVTVDADGEPRSAVYQESPLQVFRDPRAQQATPAEVGQTSTETCTIYSQTKMRTTDAANPSTPTTADVLFDVAGFTGEPGSAWIVSAVLGWRDALGWEIRLARQGTRGLAPWI